MGARGQGAKGVKGSKVYSILGFRVPTTSVGAWDEAAKGSKGGEGGEGEQRGAKGSEGEQSIFHTRFTVGSPPPLWEHGMRERREQRGAKGSEGGGEGAL